VIEAPVFGLTPTLPAMTDVGTFGISSPERIANRAAVPSETAVGAAIAVWVRSSAAMSAAAGAAIRNPSVALRAREACGKTEA